jgi:tetratricopeptide (TPR) repeat protein
MFLAQRISAMKNLGNMARDVLIYFIGHGDFAGQSQDYYLAPRRTRHSSLRASAIPMKSLVETILGNARHLRRFMILDCCFAGSAFYTFQGDPSQGAIQQTIDAFKVNIKGKARGVPEEGTTLLCSSDQQSASLLMPDGSSTMFSKALLDALSVGGTDRQDYLSFRDLNDLAADLLYDMSLALEVGIPKPPRPALASPDQRRGDIADVPFFPNPQAEEDRARLAKVERARKAEEDRARLAEEEKERARLAEVERARKAEEDRARLAEVERIAKEALKQERARQAEKKQQKPNSLVGLTTDLLTARKNKDQWFNAGRTHHQAQQYQKAIDAYSRTIALDPSYTWAYYNRGNAYSDLKQYKEAIADYDRALQLDPGLDLAKTKRAGVQHLLTRS